MYRPIELRLVEQQREFLSALGMSAPEADSTAREAVDSAIAAARATNRYDVGPLGSWAIGQTRGPIADYLLAAREEGVQDADILEWWDLDEVERQLVVLDDTAAHLATFQAAWAESGDPSQAGRIMWETHVFYDYDFGTIESPNARDALLPVELKHRVTTWIESYSEEYTRNRAHPTAGHFLPEGIVTMNAWVREMIRKDLL